MLNISDAEKFVKDEKIKYITTSQIRKFLAAVNKISNMVKLSDISEDKLDNNIIEEIKYMQIQFAYLVGKSKGTKTESQMKSLYELLKDEMSNLHTKKDFINFARYIEAIVAYHKFHGGREQ